MNISLVIFFAFVALVYCDSVLDEKTKQCEAEGPAVYCSSDLQAKQCGKTLYCLIHRHGDWPRIKSPAAVNGNQKENGNRKQPEPSAFDHFLKVYGDAMLRFQSRPGRNSEV